MGSVLYRMLVCVYGIGKCSSVYLEGSSRKLFRILVEIEMFHSSCIKRKALAGVVFGGSTVIVVVVV